MYYENISQLKWISDYNELFTDLNKNFIEFFFNVGFY